MRKVEYRMSLKKGDKWRVGLYGGVFDPPHNAHLEGIKLVQNKYNFDHLMVSVCHTPCHKNIPIASYERRRLMVEYMLATQVKMKPEVTVGGDHHLPQPSYTINQVKYAHETLAESFDLKVFLIIGADEWNSFPSWHKAKELYDLCESIIVLERKGCVIQEYDEFKCEIVENNIPSISSTQIREMIQSGEDASDFLPPIVNSLAISFYQEDK